MTKIDCEIDDQIPVYNKTEHPTIEIYCPIVKQKIPIDVGISELLSLLWSEGIMTFNSCEDNFGQVWIEIANSDELEQFINTILTPIFETQDWEFNDWMYSRITGCMMCESMDWIYSVNIDDSGYLDDENTWHDELPVYLRYSVRFPKEDYPHVLELFKQGINRRA